MQAKIGYMHTLFFNFFFLPFSGYKLKGIPISQFYTLWFFSKRVRGLVRGLPMLLQSLEAGATFLVAGFWWVEWPQYCVNVQSNTIFVVLCNLNYDQ